MTSQPPASGAPRSFLQVFALSAGLYVIRHMGLRSGAAPAGGVASFAIAFCPTPGAVTFLGENAGEMAYLRRAGEAIALRVGARGANIHVAEIAPGGAAGATIIVTVGRLDPPLQAPPPRGPLAILAHVQNQGDRMFAADDWAGGRDAQNAVEGFAVNWTQRAQGVEIECATDAADGAPVWRPAGAFMGTRGHGVPLTGFALRLSGPNAGQYTLDYRGRFADGSEAAAQPGEFCHGPTGKEALVALRVTLKHHAAAQAPAAPKTGRPESSAGKPREGSRGGRGRSRSRERQR
jgi:hypothetical protein